MKPLIGILLLLIVQTLVVAQRGADPDSLRQLLGIYPTNDSRHLQTKVNLANYFIYHDLDSATVYIDQVLACPDVDKKLPVGYARHYLVKAWTYHGRMMLKESKKWYFKSLAAAKSGTDMAQVREIELNLGALLVELQAPEARSLAEDIIQRVENPQTREDKVHWLLGKFYIVRINEYEDKLFDALDILQDKQVVAIAAQIPQYQFSIHNSKATILSRIGNETLAIEHYKKALKLTDIEKFERKDLLQNIAATFLDLEQPDSCLLYLEYAKTVSPLTENEQWTYAFHKSSALRMKGQTASASCYIDTAIVLAQTIENSNYLYRSMLKKAELCADVQDWGCTAQWLGAAQPYQVEVDLLQANTLDALLELKLGIAKTMPALLPELDTFLVRNHQYTSMMNDKQLKQVIYQYEVKQKEQENALLRQELDIERQRQRIRNLWLWLLGVTATAMIGLALFWRRNTVLTRAYNSLLEEENAQLVFEKAELAAMNDTLQQRVAQYSTTTMRPENTKVEIRGRDKLHLLDPENILYVTAEDEGVRFFLTDNASIWSDTTLQKSIDLLPAGTFIRIFRSTIVNERHITWVNHSSLRMVDGTELTIGRTYKQDIKERFGGM
jgi:tetratricopeptide (TPR) repeat protein